MTDRTLNREEAVPAGIGFFDRYLTLWVALCIVAGVALGHMMPGLFHAIGAAEVAKVNIPVAVLIWLMVIPMLLKIDFAAMREVGRHWRGIGVTLFVNWAVKPFSMAVLGWIFVGWLFRPYLPAGQIDSYIAGLIILAAAPCTAMVFVWSNLTSGEPSIMVKWRLPEDESGVVGDEGEPLPLAITLSYDEAGRWMDGGERVDRVPMPGEMAVWLAEFVQLHWKPEEKRKRRGTKPSFMDREQFAGMVDRERRGGVAAPDAGAPGGTAPGGTAAGGTAAGGTAAGGTAAGGR